MEIVLPTTKIKPVSTSPQNLIIFSKPKVGKTTLFAALPDCLILDLEKGSNYVEAMKITAESVEDIKAIGKAIKEAGRPYKYVVVDTITALEEMCIPLAEKLFSQSPMGKNWYTDGKTKYGSILNMPNGSGYPWLREAFTMIIQYIKQWAPRIILSGHVKDVLLEKNGSEFTGMDLNLTGKLKQIITSQSDAIGYLHRRGNTNILSFKTKDDVSCGARPEHLRNKEFEISKIDEDGNVTVDWSQIYID
jgi:hypothetical protein